jgi:hypothetical protein
MGVKPCDAPGFLPKDHRREAAGIAQMQEMSFLLDRMAVFREFVQFLNVFQPRVT